MPDKKGQNLADLIYGQDSIRPTEVKRPAALGLGQALQRGHEFVSKPFGYPNPPAEAISEFLGVPAIARTLERLGYGEPLTTGKGMTTKPKEDTVEALLSVAPLAPATKGMPVGAVIKPKGGNWLTGSVEKSLAPLRDSVSGPYNPTHRDEALKNWIDRNLANYIKKEMATPEDPVRRLAEQGILHRAPYEIPEAQSEIMLKRIGAGMPAKSVAQTELGQFWEKLADRAIEPYSAGAYKHGALDESILERNPWLQNVPDETMVYYPKGLARDTGFDHIIDVLREDLATGRIRPEQLNKVSMEQAVRRTYEYDQELAKKMAEATAAARTGLPVYKEYPEKYRWIELNRPGAFASESEAMGHSVRGYEPPKGHPDWTPASGDSGSPSYGHGGWEAIKSGNAKVYSLVDEKGQPHVTVEVGPPRGIPHEEAIDQAKKEGLRGQAFAERVFDLVEGVGSPPRISQIKGKQNAAPKEEYLPFVQDFVKSGQWSDVGDLRNTGLENIANYKESVRAAAEEVYPGQKFLTLEQIQPLVNAEFEKKIKSGGPVHISNNPDTMRLELAGGGGVDRLTPQDMLYLTSHPDFAKMSAQQQREAVVNMGDRELSERLKGKMAEGGAAFGAYTTGKKYQKARERAQESGASEVVEGALRGILGLEPQEDAGARGMDAYRNLQAVSNSPTPLALAALPAGIIKRAKSSEALGHKFVYPQESALERARQNAVKLLGLPENNTPEMRAKAMGYMDYLHGTERMDRLLEGKTLDPRRATSGPMPYGTTTPELASSYATSKADTSRRATDEGDVRKYFEVAPKDIGVKGIRSPIPVERAWYFMSPEQKAKIQNLAPRVGYENLDEFTGNFIVHPEGVNATLSPNQWDWFMKNEAKGNPLTALREMWYSSGQLVDEPERLAEIYRLAGIDAPISQTKAPWTEAQGVLLGKARITNPIDTSNTEQVSALIEPLKQAFAKDRSKTKVGGPDQWAKESRYTPKTWVAELEKDLSEGKESYVWTSIPDKVTAELKKLGFNGIIDRSGKGGGAKEPVVIPFDPSQVRSRFAAFDPAEMEAADLLKAYGGAIKKAPGGEVTVPDMTDGGKVIDGGPFKKGGKVQFTDNLDTMRLAVGRK